MSPADSAADREADNAPDGGAVGDGGVLVEAGIRVDVFVAVLVFVATPSLVADCVLVALRVAVEVFVPAPSAPADPVRVDVDVREEDRVAELVLVVAGLTAPSSQQAQYVQTRNKEQSLWTLNYHIIRLCHHTPPSQKNDTDPGKATTFVSWHTGHLPLCSRSDRLPRRRHLD